MSTRPDGADRDRPGRRQPRDAAARGVSASEPTAWTERTLRTLAAVFVVTWSFRLSGYLTFGTWLAIPVVLLGLTGLLAVVAAWLPSGTLAGRRQRQIDLAVLAAVIVALGIWSYFQVYIAPDYGTDEVAFDQYAAQLALHGINPYLHSMAAAFPLFHVSPNGYTFLLNGQPVTKLSYPALAFEEYLPLLAMGVTHPGRGLDRRRSLGARRGGPLRGAAEEAGAARGRGGQPRRLHRVRGRRGHRLPVHAAADRRGGRLGPVRLDPGPAAWRGPVLMGLAMAVKQTPWLIVPFVVAGIVLESRRLRGWAQGVRDGLRYLGIAVVAFLVPNLPYLLNAPRAWLSGILTPVTAQTVPAGPGPDQPQPVAPGRGRVAAGLQLRGPRGLPGPARLLPGHLPGAQAGRLPPPVDRAVLRHPLLRQLPGHADPGRGGRRGDHAAPAAWRRPGGTGNG